MALAFDEPFRILNQDDEGETGEEEVPPEEEEDDGDLEALGDDDADEM